MIRSRQAFSTALSALLLAGAVAGCTAPEAADDPVVAIAFDQPLHRSELRQVIPIGTPSVDSVAMAQAFIRNWLEKQVVLNKAEANLAEADRDFEAKLLDYRNSLLLFAYEQELVKQKLDTAIAAEEMQSYLDEHKVDFALRDGLVRARWFRITWEDEREVRPLAKAFERGGPEDKSMLERWLAERSIPITDRSASWTTWAELRSELPVEQRERAELLERDQRVVLRGQGQALFLEILEHRVPGELSPLSVVERDIRAIILNQRKLQLLERMRQDLYREATERKDIRIL
ncbi:MAG: hypothetical protein R2817_08375 [Flavobacteriales bacterium]